MSVIKQNIAANFGGRAIGTIVSLAAVPVYIRIMGVESYGLVGVFVSLQALLWLLDRGLTTAVNREMARMAGLPEKAQDMRNMMRSLEFVYWTVALIVGLIVVLLAEVIALHWVNTENIAESTVKQSVIIIGGVFALQWPMKLYLGGLMGMQRQVIMSVIETSSVVLRATGAVLILMFISPTIEAFFIWQMCACAITLTVTAITVWRVLPETGVAASFNLDQIKGVWSFAVGTTSISIVSFVLINMDKIVLSKLLTLKLFGYYVLATSAAAVLGRFIGPVYNAVFPRLSQLVYLGAEDQTSALYHKSCQFMSLVILPFTIIAALFSHELFFVWTGDNDLVNNAAPIFTIFIIGSALNGLMNIPYALQLAYGWTRLAFCVNLTAIFILVPLLFVFVNKYGAIGGAISWLILNTGYVLVSIQIMHTRLLKGQMWEWYLLDVGKPLAVSLLIAVPMYLLLPVGLSRISMAIYVICSGIITFIIVCVSTSLARAFLRSLSHRLQWKLP